jgi:hypothetical protein
MLLTTTTTIKKKCTSRLLIAFITLLVVVDLYIVIITVNNNNQKHSSINILKSPFILEAMDMNQLETSVTKRYIWGISSLPFAIMNEKINANMALTTSDKCFNIPNCYVSERWHWSGYRHSHERFEMMGPIVEGCKDMRKFGTGDEEKRICWSSELNKPGCVVYSIGSKNQFKFEESIAENTPCEIHTFDCTVQNPTRIPPKYRDRITFHSICLGHTKETLPDGKKFDTLAGITQLVGKHATFLKMDIEGFEWNVLPGIVSSAISSLLENPSKNTFPTQIGVEVHFSTLMSELSWRGRDKSPGEILALFNHLFYAAGYAVLDRNDNPLCPYCTEILLVRVLDVAVKTDG